MQVLRVKYRNNSPCLGKTQAVESFKIHLRGSVDSHKTGPGGIRTGNSHKWGCLNNEKGKTGECDIPDLSSLTWIQCYGTAN